jgi:prefoldin subunit 4
MDNQQVTKEDQGYINEFSRLHQKNKNINSEISIIKARLDNTKDASSRCDELFGDNAKIMIGETFVEVPEEKAKLMIEQIKNKQIKQIKEFEEKFNINKKRLDELKIILYSKFKNSINLDE